MARRRGSQLFRQLLLPQPFILILIQLCRGARAALAGGPQVQIPLLILICTPALQAETPISPATLDQTAICILKPDLASGNTGTRLVPVSPEFLSLSIQLSQEAPTLRLLVGSGSRSPPSSSSSYQLCLLRCHAVQHALSTNRAFKHSGLCLLVGPRSESPPHPHLHASTANQDITSSSRSSEAV